MLIVQQMPQVTLGPIGGGDTKSFGPFAAISLTDAKETIVKFASLASNLIALFTIIAGLWFGFQLIIGGFSWLTSGGDKTNLENARNRLFNAFTGLIIVVAAWAIIAVIGTITGLDILLTNPDRIACSIRPNCTWDKTAIPPCSCPP